MLLNIVKKDITKLSGNCVICHCISADATMGAGVALALTHKYPDLKPTVQSSLRMAHPDNFGGACCVLCRQLFPYSYRKYGD